MGTLRRGERATPEDAFMKFPSRTIVPVAYCTLPQRISPSQAENTICRVTDKATPKMKGWVRLMSTLGLPEGEAWVA